MEEEEDGGDEDADDDGGTFDFVPAPGRRQPKRAAKAKSKFATPAGLRGKERSNGQAVQGASVAKAVAKSPPPKSR